MALPTLIKYGVPVLAAISAAPALAGPVTITLADVEPGAGPIYVTVQSEADFMQPRQTAGQVVRADNGTVTLTLPDIPPGDYAVSVWHDRNGNAQFDRAANGMPLDGWGMSLNIAPDSLRAAPSFAQARITVGAQPLSLRVPVHYPPTTP